MAHNDYVSQFHIIIDLIASLPQFYIPHQRKKSIHRHATSSVLVGIASANQQAWPLHIAGIFTLRWHGLSIDFRILCSNTVPCPLHNYVSRTEPQLLSIIIIISNSFFQCAGKVWAMYVHVLAKLMEWLACHLRCLTCSDKIL